MKLSAQLGVLALLACQSAHADWTVGFTSSGPLKMGMSLQQVNRALGENFRKDEIPGPDPTGRCFQVDLTKVQGVELMFIDDKLTRIDVYKPGLHTANGVGVGDPEATVSRVYDGQLSRSAHAYAEGGSYLTTLDASRKHGIRFEIESGRVTKFYSGSSKAIQYVEGCA